MAAPSNKTLTNLSGTWHLNKRLSNDITKILALQGTNALLRQAISAASVTLTISQPQPNEYQIKQTATSASIPGTTEQYVLDYKWRQNHDAFFGDVRGRSRWITVEEAVREYADVKGDWEEERDGRLILAEGGKPDQSWTARRIWGFEEVGGERRYTQRAKVGNKSGEEVTVMMVYDFAGEEA